MDDLENRVRALERQVRRYRILNITLAALFVVWLAYVIWRLMHLPRAVLVEENNPALQLRVGRLEIGDSMTSRPSIVLRTDDGGGRIEVFSRDGAVLAGVDGNSGIVVRSAGAARFPETRPR